ncbi:Ribonuclease D [Pseudomonas sp. Teo4]|nr:Ribonuclease D [Pseudomonas sp. Teo4]
MAIEIHWIRDDQTLAEHCLRWRELPFVALDTEFMRVDTFTPRLAWFRSVMGNERF